MRVRKKEMNVKFCRTKRVTIAVMLGLMLLLSLLSVAVFAADGTVENAVAEVTANGTTVQYDSLPAAVAAAEAEEGSTVKLLTDVSITEEIDVNGGSFTIDLNGKTWEKTAGFALWIYGGQVTLTSTNGRGTINGYISKGTGWGGKDQHNNAIVVADYATLHVTDNVRMNELSVAEAANLTLEPGVIITYKFLTRGDSIAPFLSGKALQRCDEDGNTINEYVSLEKSYRMDDMGCVMVIDHSTCAGHVVNGVCEVCGNACDHSGATGADAICPDCDATLALTMTLTGMEGNTLELQYSAIAHALEYLKGKSYIPGTDDRIETATLKLRSGISLASDKLDFDGSSVLFVLDLNGSTLTLSDSIDLSRGKLTACNGTICATKNVFCALRVSDKGTLTLENITDSSTNKENNYTVYDDGGNVYITSGSYGEMWLRSSGTKELSGGTFSSIYIVDTGTDFSGLLKIGYIYTDAATGAYIPADSMNSNTAVTIVKCTDHTWNGGKCTKCGYVCSHPSYEDGKCTACGMPCPHSHVVEDSGVLSCTDCYKQMVVKATTESGDVLYYSDAATAIKNAPDGSTIILLESCTIPNGVRVTNTNGITLDLNGKSLSGSSLCVGDSDIRGNAIAGTLTVIDSSEGNGSISFEVREGGTLVFNPGNIFTRITGLDVYGGSVKLYGGRIYGGKSKLSLYNNISMTDLLPDGYAYRFYSFNSMIGRLSYQDAKSGNVKYTSFDLVPEKCEHTELPTDFSGSNCTYCNAELEATLKTTDGKLHGLTDFAGDWKNIGTDGTVTLLKFITLSEMVQLKNGVNCTLYLNGYNINGDKSIWVQQNSKLTIKGRDLGDDSNKIYKNKVNCDVYVGFGEGGPGTLDVLDDIVRFGGSVYFGEIGDTQLKHGYFRSISTHGGANLYISDLLADGYAFFYNGAVQNLSEKKQDSYLTINAHTHSGFTDGMCPDCGYKCKHTNGWTEEYKCNTCGYICTHETTGDDGKCTVCGKQVFVPSAISVDITWDSMEFIYNAPSNGTWNPETHQYVNATAGGWTSAGGNITIINNGEVSILAKFTYTPAEGMSEIGASFTAASLTVGSGNTDRSTLTISGTPSAEFDSKQLGTVSISISISKQGLISQDGKTYCYDSNGQMVTGWQTDVPGWDNQWFYFDDIGVMRTGWIEIDGTWYYFDETGRLVKSSADAPNE